MKKRSKFKTSDPWRAVLETFCVWNICSSKVLSEIDYLISVGLFYYILILNACLQISSSEEEYFEKGAEGSIVLFSKRCSLKINLHVTCLFVYQRNDH